MAFATLGLAVQASAEDQRHDGEIERWVPSAALEVGIFGHEGKGNIDGTTLTGPRVFIPQPIRSGDFPHDLTTLPFASRQEVLNILYGGDFELMTPRLFEGLGSPRLFMDVNVSAVQGAEVGLARDADPGEMRLPEPRSPSTVVGEGAIVGRGNKITVQNQGPQLHAGLGVAFTLDFGEERIRVKPSLVYSRLEQDITTTTRRPIRLSNANGDNVQIDDPNDYRLLIFDDSVSEVYHGAGPALEIEYETRNRVGPFSLSVFLKGHAAHLFGDLKTRMNSTNPDYPAEQFNYKYSQDRWVYRASTGVRLRLVPKKRR